MFTQETYFSNADYTLISKLMFYHEILQVLITLLLFFGSIQTPLTTDQANTTNILSKKIFFQFLF